MDNERSATQRPQHTHFPLPSLYVCLLYGHLVPYIFCPPNAAVAALIFGLLLATVYLMALCISIFYSFVSAGNA